MPTTHGSRWFADDPAKTIDSIHVGRLRAAGAIPVGKTATPEFGAWAYTASPLLGVTRNPWDLSSHAGRVEWRHRRRGVGGHGAVRHRERRRRFDPHAGELHRSRRAEEHLRAHPDLRRHASRAERGGRMPRDDRRRHRVVARRDGRTRSARSHLPARAERQLRRRARRGRPLGMPRRVVVGPGLRDRRPRGRRALRTGRAGFRRGDRRVARRSADTTGRLHPHLRVRRRRRQVRRHRAASCGRTGSTSSTRSRPRAGRTSARRRCRGQRRSSPTAGNSSPRSRPSSTTST